MGLIRTFKLSQLPKEKSLRFDVGFINCFNTQQDEQFSTYKELFDFVENEKVDLDYLDNFNYVEIGNIEKNGDINPVNLSFGDRNEENENYFKKIEKGDILKPKIGDILMSSIRPYLNKNVLVLSDDTYYTKAMIQIRPRINSKLFYYSIRTVFYDLINAVSRQGKGYPTLKEDDLKTIKFPKKVINALVKSELLLLKKIEPIEQEIQTLKSQKKDHLEIINEVFADEFKIDLQQIQQAQHQKISTLKLSNISKTNDLRSAVKFHSTKYDFLNERIFQNFTMEDFTLFMSLGRQIKPENFSENSEYYYLMPKAIKNFYLEEDELQLIDQDFFDRFSHIKLKENDIVLVASGEGSIGKSAIFNSNLNCITSQFIMKIEVNQNLIDLNYLHYYMQSSFFQLTIEKFKKGMGNMTNIFVSQVKNFPILFDSRKQQQIVEKIKSQIDTQKLIDEQIEQKQKEISSLIEESIKV